MTARDVQKILGARVLTGEEFLDREVRSACGSDMMSDVLAFSKDHSVDRSVQSSGNSDCRDAGHCLPDFCTGEKARSDDS